jgi:hypothetical protein
MDYFKYYNTLGFHNPYYLEKEGIIETYSTFGEAITKLDGPRVIDFTSLFQILNRGYIFGDRSLIKGLNKSPWMARPNNDNSDWEYFNVPNHEERLLNVEVIADTLFSLLKQEMLDYIKGHKSIGILLTGGMDSRIIACVLHNLIKHKEVNPSISVTGLTWGNPDSRDVVYASQIARRFNWDWQHIVNDASQLMDNITISVNNGCECSPIHLHALSKVTNFIGLDCVIAGSFGDSIGRGEYSGVKVEKLKSHDDGLVNFGGFLRRDILSIIKAETKEDISRYHKLFPQKKSYQQYEQDYQLHYMRRMLNSCMSIVDKRMPLFQMFSSPSVFGFMWSLAPRLRNDYVYKEILDKFGAEVSEIPWARTGLKYPLTHGSPDNYSKRHHNYEEFLRYDILPKIKSKILSKEICDLHLFNMRALEEFITLCERKPIKDDYYYDDKLFWLATFSEFVKKFQIGSNLPGFVNQEDRVSGIISKSKYLYKLYR